MEAVIGYLTVAIAAATPWIELAVVIPLAITAGSAPVPVALVALVGNALPVLGIITLWTIVVTAAWVGGVAALAADEFGWDLFG